MSDFGHFYRSNTINYLIIRIYYEIGKLKYHRCVLIYQACSIPLFLEVLFSPISCIFSSILWFISSNIRWPESVSLSISVSNSFHGIWVIWVSNWVVINQRILFMRFQLQINWLKDWVDVSVHPSFFLVSNGFSGIWVIWIWKTTINPFSINIFIEISGNPKLHIFISTNLHINWLVDRRNISIAHSFFFISNSFSGIWIIWEVWSRNIFWINILIKISF